MPAIICLAPRPPPPLPPTESVAANAVYNRDYIARKLSFLEGWEADLNLALGAQLPALTSPFGAMDASLADVRLKVALAFACAVPNATAAGLPCGALGSLYDMLESARQEVKDAADAAAGVFHSLLR